MGKLCWSQAVFLESDSVGDIVFYKHQLQLVISFCPSSIR